MKFLKKDCHFFKNYLNTTQKKCNSASSFSGCVQRLKSKCSIALPTDAEIIKLFEKTVMGGYICVNTRVGFDTDLFLKNTKKEKLIFKTAEG